MFRQNLIALFSGATISYENGLIKLPILGVNKKTGNPRTVTFQLYFVQILLQHYTHSHNCYSESLLCFIKDTNIAHPLCITELLLHLNTKEPLKLNGIQLEKY